MLSTPTWEWREALQAWATSTETPPLVAIKWRAFSWQRHSSTCFYYSAITIAYLRLMSGYLILRRTHCQSGIIKVNRRWPSTKITNKAHFLLVYCRNNSLSRILCPLSLPIIYNYFSSLYALFFYYCYVISPACLHIIINQLHNDYHIIY